MATRRRTAGTTRDETRMLTIGGSDDNETHGSTTDADARLAKKSRGSEKARLSYQGHVLDGEQKRLGG